MKNTIVHICFICLFLISHNSKAQAEKTPDLEGQSNALFSSESSLPVQLSFSTKEIRRKTNDSTYINSTLGYRSEDDSWKTFDVDLRVRGDFRLRNCYFPPLKIQINKSESKGTLFEGNKELKLTVQCSAKKGTNDYVIKEYMAYKLYELISDYHYKTRLADISFKEIKGSDSKEYEFKGFFVEDTKKAADRLGGDVMKRLVHPMAQDPLESVHNAFFMYMIGNTDFSTYVQHNEKLLFVDEKIVPLPYDFDMSGLVNASYATISEANEEPLPISSVRERLYRGFKRDPKIIAQVRQEFLDKKNEVMAMVDGLAPLFENPKEFSESKDYLLEFYKVMEDDELYHKEITRQLRTK